MNALWLLLLAVPGPDSTAVVANANDPESVALAEHYREARDLPAQQICLLDLPPGPDIELAEYLEKLEAPFEACLGDRIDRIEAVVVMRGVPLRVNVGGQLVSTTAAIAIGRSTILTTGERVLGQPPGQMASCGDTPCIAARWANPFLRGGTFEPGFTIRRQGVEWRLRIAAMIHGRSFDEAKGLIESAIEAEAERPAGTFLFMDGADPARGVLDFQYEQVIADLEALGFTTERVPFDPDLSGRELSAFFVGTAALGDAIEGNTFLPGALVDNVTSYGAAPANFGEPSEEVQVSIARWVAKGVAGVHGTVDEPLNNVFPNRRLIVDYAEGGTLGEAFARHLPYVYWKNVVLGDPMAAPYADRPKVEIEVIDDRVSLTATHAEGIESLSLFVDGEPTEDPILPHRTVELLAVAQAGGVHRPKGWIRKIVTYVPPVEPDAGVADALPLDASADDAAELPMQPSEAEGCACSSVRVTRGVDWRSLSLLAPRLMNAVLATLRAASPHHRSRAPLFDR